MNHSGQFVISLILLLLAAAGYLVALATTSWSISGQLLVFGLWQYCFLDTKPDGEKIWKCLTNNTDFTMVSQAFSILAVMCYFVAFLLYMASVLLSSLHRCRPMIMALCLLTFCIVSLQIMSMVVFGVKIGHYFKKLEDKHFDISLEPLTISWSSTIGIISNILATAAGVCLFLELRNVAMEELNV
ncbi:hypothetical protein SNE40_018394 [Patella caerulea]|uniref:Uncharacterized protein n=1 Tax=Patella caerulea TaxID=87958 RepID=A0AAN8J9I2_PATCE